MHQEPKTTLEELIEFATAKMDSVQKLSHALWMKKAYALALQDAREAMESLLDRGQHLKSINAFDALIKSAKGK